MYHNIYYFGRLKREATENVTTANADLPKGLLCVSTHKSGGMMRSEVSQDINVVLYM
jgi:hypothetical protein